jgi:hypothetical protein
MVATPPKPTFNTSAVSAFGQARSTVEGIPLSTEELQKMHAFWRAANYLAVGMIYLRDNPPPISHAYGAAFDNPNLIYKRSPCQSKIAEARFTLKG